MKARVPQGPSMNAMIKQAQKMQEDMAALQADLEEREYEISAGGGAAKIKINGKKEIVSLEIAPEIVDPDDVETLCDILTAGINEAIKRVVSQFFQSLPLDIELLLIFLLKVQQG